MEILDPTRLVEPVMRTSPQGGRLDVLFVVDCFPPDEGGLERYNAELAVRLHAAGHRVRVFAWDLGSEGAAQVDAALPFPVHRSATRLGPLGIEPTALAPALRRWRPRVVFASGTSTLLGASIRMASRFAPVVVSVHDIRWLNSKGSLRKRLKHRLRFGLQRARAIVVNSSDTRARVLTGEVAEERVSIVHPGVDSTRFRPDPDAGSRVRSTLGIGDRRMLLTVAGLRRNKGHLRVLAVLERLVRDFPDLAYVVVGDGELSEELHCKVQSRGLTQHVHLVGRVVDPSPYYNACDVFVMPSTNDHPKRPAAEGFGSAYLEAAACGKPVIGSSSGGATDIVVEGRTGFLVSPRDDEALEKRLRWLLANPEGSRRMGVEGRRRVGLFQWEGAVARLEAVLARAELEAPWRRRWLGPRSLYIDRLPQQTPDRESRVPAAAPAEDLSPKDIEAQRSLG